MIPRFHHWHHAIEHEAIDKNFCDPLPLARPPVLRIIRPMTTGPQATASMEQVPGERLGAGALRYPFVRKQPK